jgi:Protein of unknown function (DUF3181)
MANNQQIEELAAEIGEQVYPLLTGGLTGDKLTEILTNISIDLGGGRLKTPLINLIPVTAQARLMDVLQEYARNL